MKLSVPKGGSRGCAVATGLLTFFQPLLQIGKGIVGRSRRIRGFALISGIDITRMLIVVTIQAQQLPVAAVLWVIIMVMIPVMHRQLAGIFAVKLAPTSTAYPGIHFHGLLAVTLTPFFGGLTGISDDLIELSRVGILFNHGFTLKNSLIVTQYPLPGTL